MARLSGLDALRGIAAIAVVLHHLWQTFPGLHFPVHAQLAVDLFFVISGFVMARTYEPRMRRGLTALQFIKLRYRRLWLPLAIGSSIGLAWALQRHGLRSELAPAFLLILAFMPAWWMANSFLLNLPAWSLFLEICVNALHGATLGKMSNRGLLWLWAGMAIVFVVTHSFGAGWKLDIRGVGQLFPRAMTCYLAGILMFRHYGDRPLGNSPLLAIAAFVPLLFLAPLHPIIEIAAVLIACPLIVRASLALKEAQLAMWLGALSYPLYATHFPVMLLSLLNGFGSGAAVALVLSVALVVLLLTEARPAPAKPITV